MRKLIYRLAANRDLKDIADFIGETSGDLDAGLAVAERFRAQCAKLAASPILLGRPREELSPGLRGYLFRDYIIFFRCTDERLEIVNILHSRRDLAATLDSSDDSP
ncbi:type II toxin-antitoxin system RelE/ParE family toxin [Methylosinus sp. RM1]|uniref:type II toxin-antitoxin system RelE/ParE family toxin n=1 Tax=Methylosinus sp. RM1 TaxID=2583817 RepID=UPI00140D95BB|nr:type II toxin-antitoxin system RelE/ParE family toxin [Methylosinus sp. RM1]